MPGIGKKRRSWLQSLKKSIFWGGGGVRQNVIWGIGEVDAKMQGVCQRRG